LETDGDVIEAALQTVGLAEPEDTKIVHISDTLHLREVLVSEVYLSQVEDRDDLTILDGPNEMEFDSDSNLIPVSAAGAAVAAH